MIQMCESVADVGNVFATNFMRGYIRNGVFMHISGCLYIFVGMWDLWVYKKYFKNLICFTKKLFIKKIPTFPHPLTVDNQGNRTSMSITSKNKTTLQIA